MPQADLDLGKGPVERASKRSNLGLLLAAFALACSPAWTGAAPQGEETPVLLRPADAGAEEPAGEPPAEGAARILRHRLLELDPAVLVRLSSARRSDRELPEKVSLHLFDDLRVELEDLSVTPSSPSSYRIRCVPRGYLQGTVTLLVRDGNIRANLQLGDRLIRIRPVGDGLHWAIELDPASFPAEGEPPTP